MLLCGYDLASAHRSLWSAVSLSCGPPGSGSGSGSDGKDSPSQPPCANRDMPLTHPLASVHEFKNKPREIKKTPSSLNYTLYTELCTG